MSEKYSLGIDLIRLTFSDVVSASIVRILSVSSGTGTEKPRFNAYLIDRDTCLLESSSTLLVNTVAKGIDTLLNLSSHSFSSTLYVGYFWDIKLFSACTCIALIRFI